MLTHFIIRFYKGDTYSHCIERAVKTYDEIQTVAECIACNGGYTYTIQTARAIAWQ